MEEEKIKVAVYSEFEYNRIIREGDRSTKFMLELDEAVLQEIGKTKRFDIELGKIVDYVPESVELTDEKKRERYEKYVTELIRERYSVSQELALLRQRDVKLDEFNDYDAYAEECKARAKATLGLEV